MTMLRILCIKLCLFALLVSAFSSNAGLIESVFINEVHYDNVGGDSEEFIEILALMSTDLTGFSLQLYNGANGSLYHSHDLTSAVLNDLGNGWGGYAAFISGIQNGAPDGFALVNNSNQVLQFLSYEGTFSAIDGAAQGLTSVDIGVFENNAVVGTSLQLGGVGNKYSDFSWQASAQATANIGNVNQTLLPFHSTNASAIPNLPTIWLFIIGGVLLAFYLPNNKLAIV